MSIKYGSSNVKDVKICQNGMIVNVKKITKDGVTLWQKTTHSVWSGTFGDKNISLDEYSESGSSSYWSGDGYKLERNYISSLCSWILYIEEKFYYSFFEDPDITIIDKDVYGDRLYLIRS